MTHPIEEAKKIVGRAYTTSRAKELQELVPDQAVEVLSSGYVRAVGGKKTFVVVDADEQVIAILVGDGM